MKAISLWQPWATAIAVGLKSIETRGWATRYRGPIAIHAARRWMLDQQIFADQVRALDARLPTAFHFGAVVAVAWVVDCVTTTEILPTIGPVERAYGEYGPGRYAWLLEDVQALTSPLTYIGRQGFFDVPVELLNPLAPGWFSKGDLARA